MRNVLSFFFLALCSFSYAQHSEYFLDRTKGITPSDTSSVERYYKNGIVKEAGTTLTYKMPEYTYHKKYGEYKTYYKDGALKSSVEYDRLGNPLSAVFYNNNGTTWWKSKTLEIDLAISDPKKYFLSDRPVILTKWNKEMKYGYDIEGMYIRSEGKTINGTKAEIWKVYDEEGRLMGEIDHSK
ncbi:MAG: hypothetical protein Aureis2KO_15110 [Aureisphaera sp.]